MFELFDLDMFHLHYLLFDDLYFFLTLIIVKLTTQDIEFIALTTTKTYQISEKSCLQVWEVIFAVSCYFLDVFSPCLKLTCCIVNVLCPHAKGEEDI